jgi:hypothetical protein
MVALILLAASPTASEVNCRRSERHEGAPGCNALAQAELTRAGDEVVVHWNTCRCERGWIQFRARRDAQANRGHDRENFMPRECSSRIKCDVPARYR